MADQFLGVGTPPLSAPVNYSLAQPQVYNPTYIPNIYAQGINLNLYANDFINWMSCSGAPGLGSPCSQFDPKLAWNALTDTNLSAFKARGGKLIIIRGLADRTLSPLATVNYYKDVVAKIGSLNETRGFARLSLVPGRTHGTSVLQAGVQNGIGAPANVGLSGGANTGWLHAIEDWVATGTPPNSLQGTDTFTPPALPTITRPICAYPFKAVYTGPAGDAVKIRDAAYFECRYYRSTDFLLLNELPNMNIIKAGSIIPMAFLMDGNYGKNILARSMSSPSSIQIDCSTKALMGSELASSSLLNVGLLNEGIGYLYPWQTNKTWKGTCRQFILRMNEGTTIKSNLKFN